MSNSSVKVTFLGGLGNIGRNCAAVEVDGQIMLIDCGIMFPEDTMPGVDKILPDFSYLRENMGNVVGVVLSHGHEDHIGALGYLLGEMPLKIIGSALSLGFAKNRIKEKGVIDQATFVEVKDNDRIKVGAFDLEFFPVTHSVPHGFATAFHTPQGVILHSGDFKIDTRPIDGRITDLAGLGHLSKSEGVRLLLCDSTNAISEGFSKSESLIGKSVRNIFKDVEGRRVIVACFASHIHRVQQIADAAIASGRTIITLGRSMKNNVELASELKLLNIPKNKLRDIEDIDNLADGEICVISTGSQGEHMAALSRMARGDSRWINIRKNDCIVFSSHPIPGNEVSVSRVMDGLARRGAQVIHSADTLVHTTGHAKAEELRVYHSVIRPEFFVPVHGEYRHMAGHADLAKAMGMKDENVLLCGDGNSVVLTDAGIERGPNVPSDYIYMAGSVGTVDDSLLSERNVLGQDGFVSVVISVDMQSDGHAVLAGDPEIFSRGWVSDELGETIHEKAADKVRSDLVKELGKKKCLPKDLEKIARRSLGKFINAETRRKPMVVPIILEVD